MSELVLPQTFCAVVPDVTPLASCVGHHHHGVWCSQLDEQVETNRKLMLAMTKPERLEWVKGLVRQVRAADMTFLCDVLSAMKECAVIEWCRLDSNDPRYDKRRYFVTGFKPFTVDDYTFARADDWAFQVLSEMGAI